MGTEPVPVLLKQAPQYARLSDICSVCLPGLDAKARSKQRWLKCECPTCSGCVWCPPCATEAGVGKSLGKTLSCPCALRHMHRAKYQPKCDWIIDTFLPGRACLHHVQPACAPSTGTQLQSLNVTPPRLSRFNDAPATLSIPSATENPPPPPPASIDVSRPSLLRPFNIQRAHQTGAL